jgi:dolichyl-phosphate beta-glucosyltransferase
MPAGNTEDVYLFAWFLRYSATAVAHGHLPALVTTALNAPRGISVMWNTSFLLPGILLTPVTLLAGPQVSLTIVLTLSIAGSAASLFLVLRRWGAGLAAAALGGAVYGFSPALLNSGIGHYNFALAVLPPLIIDALLRIVTGRDSGIHAMRTGAWMGLLAAAQLFIGEEVLIDTAVACLVLVLVAALGHPRAVRCRARDVAVGLVTGSAVTLLISAYALWVQFRGPLHEHNVLGLPWTGNLALFVDPSSNLLFHTSASEAVISHYNHSLPEVLAYLGWPLIVVLVAAAIRFWRDPRVRAAAVTCAALEVCNLGGGDLPIGGFRLPGAFLPYHWLQSLPVMSQVIPSRFCVLGAGAAGAVLAFSLDLARAAVPQERAWQRRIPVAVALLAVMPLIPLPYRPAPVRPVPAGWQAAFARLRLPPDARVLVVPVPLIGGAATVPMSWQADTGEPRSLIGGYFLGPSPTGQGVFSIGPTQYAAGYLNRLRSGRTSLRRDALVRSALAYWRPAAVVAVTGKRSRLGQLLTGLLGPPAFSVGRMLVWRR